MTRMPQGHCTLPTDDAGRVLDRLAGLEQMIPPQGRSTSAHGHWPGQFRSRRLTHEVVLWVVLAIGLLTDLPIRQVFKAARRLRKGEESPHRSSLGVARQRLGVVPCGTCSSKSFAPWPGRSNTVRPEFCCSEFVIAIIETRAADMGSKWVPRGRPIG